MSLKSYLIKEIKRGKVIIKKQSDSSPILNEPWQLCQPVKIGEYNPEKDGKVDGLCRVYYETGQLYREGTFVNDKLEGAFRIYYKNGKLKVEYFMVGVDILC